MGENEGALIRPVDLLLVATLLAAGCGHTAIRGSVVMKVGDTRAHVCLGYKEVAVGDQVELVRNDCPVDAGPNFIEDPLRDYCRRVVAGEGQIIKVLNEHFSVVEFAKGVQFKAGDTIEKIK
jgi:hypothetical protein